MKSHQSARFFVFLVFIALLSGSIGCTKSNDYTSSTSGGTQGANDVWLQGSMFNPATLTVAVNATVVWTNKDSFTHDVISDSTMFNSGNMGSNAIYSFHFTKKGSYKYHCSFHALMKGTIIVQ